MKHPDDPDKTLCCPVEECEHFRIYKRESDDADHRYYCRECGHEFDEPGERKREASHVPEAGHGHDWLEDADYEFEWDRDPQTQEAGDA